MWERGKLRLILRFFFINRRDGMVIFREGNLERFWFWRDGRSCFGCVWFVVFVRRFEYSVLLMD